MSYIFSADNLTVNCFWERGEAEAYNFWSSPVHFHFLHEIHFILDGEATFVLGKEKHLLKKGDMCVIPPNLTHYPIVPDPSIPRVSFFISLKKNGEGKAYDYCSKVLSNPSGAVIRGAKKAEEYLKSFIEHAKDNTFLGSQKARNYLELFFWELCDSISDYYGTADKEYNPREEEYASLRMKIDNFVSRQYMNPVTIDDLSKTIGYSKSQTARIMLKLTGKTFTRFLTCWRMEIARMLILNTEKCLFEIAETVGYRTYGGFFKAFKSVYGVYPQDIRENKNKF